ncbi:hypothetical protein SDC9_59047 [bioreactor metagenome]|uniref:Uncharacterized protein n=1 Tax=bioreactor metagenome TaxID=1076179 RepID=A0A644XEU9_9ZZZZ
MARAKVPTELKQQWRREYMKKYMAEYRKRRKEQSFAEVIKKTSSPAPRHPSAVDTSERQV